MLLISARIDWYSWFAAPSWVLLSVPFEASVASVIARSRRLVTCASAPSATSSRPTPSVAFVFDCVSADELAARPFTKERPAASSAPELILDPDDNCCRTVCSSCSCCSDYSLRRLLTGYSIHRGPWDSTPSWTPCPVPAASFLLRVSRSSGRAFLHPPLSSVPGKITLVIFFRIDIGFCVPSRFKLSRFRSHSVPM